MGESDKKEMNEQWEQLRDFKKSMRTGAII